MKRRLFILLFMLLAGRGFAQNLYFPPLTGKTWDTLQPQSLNWCVQNLDSFYNYLQSKNTRGFLVLKDGKIVLEKYFGTFTQDSFWYWASAGKTMTALMVGIAQQKSLLKISDTSSKYLGPGWTSETRAQEDKITIRHQLSMSSGLDDGGVDKDCTFDSCLVYKADAGTRWAYHNAAYTLLDQVIETASGQTYQQFFNREVALKTGIAGLWLRSGPYNNVLYSTPRSFARYGLLLLNKGKWDQTVLLSDTAYFRQMTNSSQSLNPSYGYLTWLNGKDKFMAPQTQFVFPGMLVPNAPHDMFMAMGKNGQLINVVPSENLVLVRMGDAPNDNGEVPITFNNELWFQFNKVFCKNGNSIAEENTMEAIQLYPNPGTTELHITGLSPSEKYSISLMNIQGMILRNDLSAEKIDISDLANGCYFICLEADGKKTFKRFIKN